jgi:hypothetical protein
MANLHYTTNNAYDTILLTNDAGIVVSSWVVTPDVLRDYLAGEPDLWDVQDPHGLDCGQVADYGEELDRDSAGFAARCGFHGVTGVGHTEGCASAAASITREAGLCVEIRHDTRTVCDPAGGVWWPDESAEAEIEASDDPAATALEICHTTPMRGSWRD